MKDREDFLRTEAVKNILEFHFPRWDELPSIDLYMDQVINYVSDTFEVLNQGDEKEKVLTKSMINNYVKQKVIKAPINKKYSRAHLVYIMAITMFKAIFSISEIAMFIKMQEKRYDTEVAYNYLCDEFENAIRYTFLRRDEMMPNSAKKITRETEIVRSILISISNRVYVRMFMNFLEDEVSDEVEIAKKSEKSKKTKKQKIEKIK